MENTQFIKVWNIAIRVFHWTLVGCCTLAFISSENIPRLHVIFGYSVLSLVIFRIFYGFAGTKYARFSDFLYPPAEIAAYLKGMLIGKPKHYIGHNPAGGLMIAVLILSLLFLTLTGLKTYGVKGHGPLAGHEISFVSKAFADNDEKRESEDNKQRSRRGKDFSAAEESEKNEFWKEVHETIAYFTLFLVSIHIAGAFVSSILHRENLIKAMITGRKQVV
jgi:cytochrome b